MVLEIFAIGFTFGIMSKYAYKDLETAYEIGINDRYKTPIGPASILVSRGMGHLREKREKEIEDYFEGFGEEYIKNGNRV